MTYFCPKCGRGFDNRDRLRCPEDGEQLQAIDATEHRLLGQLLHDRFRLVEVLGEGGAGVVFRAIQRPIGREVAVKVLSHTVRNDQSSYERFFREAKLASTLRHPNIVSPVDFGEDSDHNVVYFAMEYIDGIDLHELLVRHRLSVPLALEIIHQTCGALTDAHDKGIVHRDLKPRNLRLTVVSDGSLQVKVLDLGVARPLESQEDITDTGNITGTIAYLPPEYVLDGDLGAYSDLYSLGIILFKMLTGRKPFGGNHLQLMFHHIRTPPPSIDDSLGEGHRVPEFVEFFYQSLVKKEPGDRIESARKARTLIEEFRDEQRMEPITFEDSSQTMGVETFRTWLRDAPETQEEMSTLPSDIISELKGAGAEVTEGDTGDRGPRLSLPSPPPLPAHRSTPKKSKARSPGSLSKRLGRLPSKNSPKKQTSKGPSLSLPTPKKLRTKPETSPGSDRNDNIVPPDADSQNNLDNGPKKDLEEFDSEELLPPPTPSVPDTNDDVAPEPEPAGESELEAGEVSLSSTIEPTDWTKRLSKYRRPITQGAAIVACLIALTGFVILTNSTGEAQQDSSDTSAGAPVENQAEAAKTDQDRQHGSDLPDIDDIERELDLQQYESRAIDSAQSVADDVVDRSTDHTVEIDTRRAMEADTAPVVEPAAPPTAGSDTDDRPDGTDAPPPDELDDLLDRATSL